MSSENRLSQRLGMIRAAGILVMFLVALAGVPQPAASRSCFSVLMTCSSATACVGHLHESCLASPGCPGTIICTAGFGCSGQHNVAMVCDVGIPE